MAAAAFDLELGHELLQPKVREQVKNYIKEVRPGLVILSPPCTLFSVMQNMNLVKRDFIKRLREAKVLLRFAVKVIEEVINYGGVYLLEQPLTSKAWMETVLQQIMNREDCILAQCDQCQYGLQDYHGGKMKKSTGWITNSPQIANRLDKKCDGTHEHTHVLGSSGGQNRSTQAQIYPRPLIQAILDGYREEIQRQGHPKVSEQMQWMTMVDCHHLEDRIRQYENLWKWFIEEEKEKIHLVQALEEKQEDENEDEEGKKWLPRERPFSLEQLVRRAHEGLGHPGNDRLARILQGGGASKKAIEYAKKLTCSVCQQHQLVRPPRAAAPPKELPPNHTVGIDTIWLPTPGKKRRMALNIVCWATRFQMVIPLRSHTAPDARRAYLEWVRFMGVPQRLFTDLGKEFCSAFQDGAELDETLVEPSALEMPTQRAITERAGKTFKEILEKAMDNYATQSESEWRDLVDIVNMTVNRLTNKSGYSPCQRLLGYTPKMPGGLQFLTEEEKKERQWANRGDLQMQRAQTMRLAAAKAFHEIECQQAMKNAIHHGRRSIKDFEVGQTVYFWRRAPGDKASKESTRYWRGPAKVVLTSPPGAVWINFRRHIVKAAPEQLRHASMEEHQSLSSWMEGLSHLRQIIEEEPKAGYIDLTKEYKEEDFEDEEEDIPLESRDSRKEKPKYKIEGKTERKDVVMREEEDEWLWNEAKQTLTRFHLQYRQHLFKPTDVSDCPVDYNKLGPQRRTTMYFEDGSSKEIVDDWHEEAQPVHKRWKGRTEFQMMIEKFAWEKGEPEAEETTRMTSPTVSLSGTTTEEAKIGLKRGAGEDEENNEGLEKRARTETVEDQKKEEEPIRGLSRPFEIDGEDQEQIPKRQRIDWFEVMINTVMPVMKKPKGQNEIKLKQLLDEAKTKYYKAIKKEIDNNIKTGAYEILSPEASEEVRRAGHNILQSRYVLVEKRIEEDEVPAMQEEGILLRTDEHGGFKAKARHVMKGFSEPDSEWLEAATPQVAPETVLLILQTISSSRWTPGYLDFTQAFHSGDPISRLLFAEVPPEGIPGVQERQLLKLKKHCYGLLDGPYQWYVHLQKILTQLGYEQSQADPCLYFLFDTPEAADRDEESERRLEGIIGVATDDLIHGGGPRHWQQMQWIQQHYKLGKFTKGDGRFVGKEINCLPDGSIKVHQRMYVQEKIKPIEIPKERRTQKYALCTPEETSSLRTALGSLAWLAKETRPDLMGRVCILQQCMPHPYVRDMLEANALSKEAMEEVETGIVLRPIPMKDIRIGSASDASCGNSPCQELEGKSEDFWEEKDELWIRHHVQARHILFHPGAAYGGPQLHEIEEERATWIDGELFEDTWNRRNDVKRHGSSEWKGHTVFVKKKSSKKIEIHERFLQVGRTHSQGGHIVFAYHKNLETEQTPQPISVLSWKSSRLKRRTVNTLAAEAQAMVQAVGASYWIRFLLAEIKGLKMSLQNWQKQISRTPYMTATDSRSLFDNLTRSTNVAAHIEDKRTAIDLAILKNDMNTTRGQTRWVPGSIMISDSLTKKGPSTFLRGVLRIACWTLFELGAKKLQEMLTKRSWDRCGK